MLPTTRYFPSVSTHCSIGDNRGRSFYRVRPIGLRHFLIRHYSYKTNVDTEVPGFVQFGEEEGNRNFTVPNSEPASHIAPHEAVGLPGGALVGLSGENEGERHNVFRHFDPLAVVLEYRSGVLCIRLGDEIGEDWAGN